MTSHKAIVAAANNADWYSMMFDIHDVQYSRSNIAFLGADPPPPYHSWMTTLDPEASADHLKIIRQNAHRPKFVLKDGFHNLDLSKEGFAELFSATWIYADNVLPTSTAGWTVIETLNDLMLWESAWKKGGSPSDQLQFPNTILERDDVVIWGRRQSNGFDAGGIANVSKDCVGLSNCFGENALPAAAMLCAELVPVKLPIVGYERGDDLATALDIGFSAAGKLRVWSR